MADVKHGHSLQRVGLQCRDAGGVLAGWLRAYGWVADKLDRVENVCADDIPLP